MKFAPIPGDEAERLAKLRSYDVLDTDAEEAFDRIAQMARTKCGTPVSVVSLDDEKRQWFKARSGIDVSETPRDISFCGHTVYQRKTLVVEDAALDERFADNPLVAMDPNIRFYAGAPLHTPDGYVMGTLCAIDYEPRALTDEQLGLLEDLAEIAVSQLELRLEVRERAQADLVAHGPAGDEQRGRLAEQLGREALERVDRGVLAEHVVAHLGGGHRLAHGGRRAGHGVAAQCMSGSCSRGAAV